MISVIGYGSLLSERSARETVPDLQNFRLVSVPGYCRIFNKVGVVFFSRHGALSTSLEIASCATRRSSANDAMLCTQFECTEQAFEALYEREHRFEWIEVETCDQKGQRGVGMMGRGMMCTESSDAYYRQQKCADQTEYQQRVGQFYSGVLWRDDILPFPRYLAFCLQAAQSQGPEVLDSFLDDSFLADGITPIRQYIATHPQLQHWQSMDCGYSYQAGK